MNFYALLHHSPVTNPTIVPSPDINTPSAGSEFVLICETTDIQLLTLTWMVNDTTISTYPGRISTNGTTLRFSHVATSDTGSYRCQLNIREDQRYVIAQNTPLQSSRISITVHSNAIVDVIMHIYDCTYPSLCSSPP